MEILDITPFEKALTSLASILNRYEKDNFDIDIRDAVIQRFEYTYSLALKMIIRFINMQSPEVLADMTFNEAIRKANKLGLLKNNLEKKYLDFVKQTIANYIKKKESLIGSGIKNSWKYEKDLIIIFNSD